MNKHTRTTKENENKHGGSLSRFFKRTWKCIRTPFVAFFELCKKCVKTIGDWFRLHFENDINAVRGFFAGIKRNDNKIIVAIKNFFVKFWHGFKSIFGIFSRESRHNMAVAIRNMLAAVNTKIFENGFFAWMTNSAKLHKKFIGAVAIAVSAVVFLSIYTEKVYAMNCVSVIVNGENLGNVGHIEAFDESVRLVEERVGVGINGEYKLGLDVKYRFNFAPQEEISTTYEMIDKILRHSGTSVIDAYGLYVDGDLWAVCREKKTIDNVINSIIRPYQDKETDKDAVIRFVQDTEVVYGLYPAGALCSENDLNLILNGTSGYKSYRIQQFDTLENIAMMNGMTVDEIRKINPELPEALVVGSDIKVANSESKLAVQTVVRKTYDKKIPYNTEKTRTKQLYAGTKKLKQRGQNGLERITSDFIYIDGKLSEEIVIQKELIRNPVTEKVLIGTRAIGGGDGASSGKYMRPISGGYISSRYGYRHREFHTGVDFAAPKGTNIMAADGGVVAAVLHKSYGFGLHVIINHANGEQTLYGHCSETFVKVGERVDKGQVIAAVGRTGRATGNHLHFEVRRNGRHVYPGFG